MKMEEPIILMFGGVSVQMSTGDAFVNMVC